MLKLHGIGQGWVSVPIMERKGQRIYFRLHSIRLGKDLTKIVGKSTPFFLCRRLPGNVAISGDTDFRASFLRVLGKNQQACWRHGKDFQGKSGKTRRKGVCRCLWRHCIKKEGAVNSSLPFSYAFHFDFPAAVYTARSSAGGQRPRVKPFTLLHTLPAFPAGGCSGR